MSVGDYNKLVIDTKHLMSTHQLPYVARLPTTDSSGEDTSDKTNATKSTTNTSETNFSESPTKSETCCSSSSNNDFKGMGNVIEENKVNSQLPPLSPPRAKRQVAVKVISSGDVKEDTTPMSALMVNGSKFQPISSSTIPQRPNFLMTSIPQRSSSACGSSPTPLTRSPAKLSPVFASSPKPFVPPSLSPNTMGPSQYISPTTAVKLSFSPSSQILESESMTTSDVRQVECDNTAMTRFDQPKETITETTAAEQKHQQEKVVCLSTDLDAQMNPVNTGSGLTRLLTEVDEKIRFSLDIDSTLPKTPPKVETEQNAANQANVACLPSPDADKEQAAQEMKDDLSRVRKDITELKNKLTVTKQGLANNAQPLLVSTTVDISRFYYMNAM